MFNSMKLNASCSSIRIWPLLVYRYRGESRAEEFEWFNALDETLGHIKTILKYMIAMILDFLQYAFAFGN